VGLPNNKDITIYQGDTWEFIFRLKNESTALNLTGATPKAQIRPTAGSPVLVQEITAALLTQSGDTLGCVKLSLTAAQTAALQIGGVWDVQLLYSGTGAVVTYFSGKVTLVKEVTRA
jgi:hypothetical protein